MSGRLLAAAAAAGTAAAAVYFAFAFAGTSLWLDEAYSVLLARQPLGRMVELLRADNGPPGYYLLLRLWIAAFGDSERTIRALSAAAYLGTAAVIFWGGRRLHGSATSGVACAALFVASPLAVRHAFSARMYALLALWTALSCILFVLAARRPPARSGRLLTLGVNLAGLLTHYWFGFILLAQAAAVVTFPKGRRVREAVWLAPPLLAFAAVWGSVLADQLRSRGSQWIPAVGWGALIETFADFYGGWIGAGVFAAIALALLLRWRPGPRPVTAQELKARWGGREGAALALICLGAVLVPLALSQLKPIYLVGRYTVVALPPFALLVGGALWRAVPARLLQTLLLSLLALRVLASAGYQARIAARDATESSRASAARIARTASKDAIVIYTGLGGVTLSYYLRRAGRSLEQRTFPAELEAHPGWMGEAALLERPDALQEEAEALVASLPEGRPVWHVHLRDSAVGAVLQRVLERRLGTPRTAPLPGSFHDTVSIFRSNVDRRSPRAPRRLLHPRRGESPADRRGPRL